MSPLPSEFKRRMADYDAANKPSSTLTWLLAAALVAALILAALLAAI